MYLSDIFPPLSQPNTCIVRILVEFGFMRSQYFTSFQISTYAPDPLFCFSIAIIYPLHEVRNYVIISQSFTFGKIKTIHVRKFASHSLVFEMGPLWGYFTVLTK